MWNHRATLKPLALSVALRLGRRDLLPFALSVAPRHSRRDLLPFALSVALRLGRRDLLPFALSVAPRHSRRGTAPSRSCFDKLSPNSFHSALALPTFYAFGPVLLALCAFSPALAQTYPAKPVRIVVGFPPGGATDVVARTISQKLSDSLGQPVIVDNRAGAASNIGAEHVATSPKDGHTLFMGTVSTSINPSLYKKLPYDPLRDFAPVSQVTSTPFMFVVHPSLPVRSVKEFIAFARIRLGELNYGSAGSGSGAHLFVEMFSSMARVKLQHVPYKGAAPATTATLSGETIFMFDNIVTTLPLARAGRLRALGITTATRSAAAPEMPTIAEAGVPGYDANAWFGLFAPAGTPQAVINRLNSEIVKILKLPETRDRFVALGAEPVGSTAEQFGAFFKNEVAKWAKVVQESGARVE